MQGCQGELASLSTGIGWDGGGAEGTSLTIRKQLFVSFFHLFMNYLEIKCDWNIQEYYI